MPLPEEYVENIKSKIADLKNIGVKGGGSITAALFLKVCVCVYVCARTRVFVCVCVWESDPCRIEMHLAPPPPSPPALPPLTGVRGQGQVGTPRHRRACVGRR